MSGFSLGLLPFTETLSESATEIINHGLYDVVLHYHFRNPTDLVGEGEGTRRTTTPRREIITIYDFWPVLVETA